MVKWIAGFAVLGAMLLPVVGQAVAQEAALVDGGADAIQALAKEVSENFAGATAKIGGEATLAEDITNLSKDYGWQVTKSAFEKVGPEVVPTIETVGKDAAPKALGLMGTDGPRSLWVLQDTKRMSLFMKFGDDAASAMIKHEGIADPVIEEFGGSGARAMNVVDGTNAVRLAKMVDTGEIAAGRPSQKLLDVVAKYGNKGMDFIWNNKGSLAVAATLIAFLAHPKPFINGAESITHDTIGSIIRSVNWTPLVYLAVAVAIVWVGWRTFRAYRVARKKPSADRKGDPDKKGDAASID